MSARDHALLENGQPVPSPTSCDGVFAVIDTASKTGTDHDATAVTFFALDKHSGRAPLLILDWDIVQIEGALLETWLPMVFDRLEELSRLCGARQFGWGVDRGQELRNCPVAAGYPQAMASNRH
jgi:hypothetical protein